MVIISVIGQAYIDIKSKTDDFEADTTSKITSVAKKVAAIFAGAFVLDKVKDFIKGSVDAASDLSESVSKSTVVFGTQAGQIEKWAKTAATSLGQSKQQATEAAATYGNLFVALGLTGQKAADMSINLVNLAGDLASFNNVSPEDALLALRSGLSGETEPLRKFGINMNDATIRAQALKMGLISTIKDALDPSVKAQASYGLILQQTKTAQGDFARTSGGLANQQRILAARMEDVKARVGTALLPAFLAVTSVVSEKLGPALDFLGRSWSQLSEAFTARQSGLWEAHGIFERIGVAAAMLVFGVKALFSAFNGEGVTSNGFVGAMERLGVLAREAYDRIRPLAIVIKDNLIPILGGLAAALATVKIAQLGQGVAGTVTKIGAAATKAGGIGPMLLGLANPVTLIAVGIAALAAGLIYAYFHFDKFREIVDNVIHTVSDTVMTLINSLLSWWEGVWPQFSEAVGHTMRVIEGIITVVWGIVTRIWRAVGDDLLRFVEGTFGAIRMLIEGVMNVISGIIKTVLALINGDWGKAWDGIKQIVQGVWQAIHALISEALNLTQLMVTAALSVLINTFKGTFGNVVQFFKDLPGTIVDALRALPGVLFNLAGDTIRFYVNGYIVGAKLLWEFFASIPQRAMDALAALAPIMLRLGKDIIAGLIRGITDAAGDLIRTIKETITDKIPGFIKGAFGISSPSKVFATFGRQMVEGMAVGLGDTGSVDRALRHLTALPGGRAGQFSGSSLGISSRSMVVGPGAVNLSITIGGGDKGSADYAASVAAAAVTKALQQVVDGMDRKNPAA